MSYPIVILNEQIEMLSDEYLEAEGIEREVTKRRLIESIDAVKLLNLHLVVGRSEQLFCPHCGYEKEHKIYTDANSELVCRYALCRAK